MPIKKLAIQTKVSAEGEGVVNIPILITNDLKGVTLYDLAHVSSLREGYLPYLFVGHSENESKGGLWHFANARRHEDLQQAVEQEVGGDMRYAYGQMHFNETKMKQGKLELEKVVFHQEISEDENERKEALKKMMDVINPRFLASTYQMKLLGSYGWRYNWTKSDNKLLKVLY